LRLAEVPKLLDGSTSEGRVTAVVSVRVFVLVGIGILVNLSESWADSVELEEELGEEFDAVGGVLEEVVEVGLACPGTVS
jgi:hypothetical protein